MSPEPCRQVEDRLDEVVGGVVSVSIAEHLAVCGRCAGLVRRQRRLAQALEALPAAPAAAFAPPQLPAGPGGRVLAFGVPAWAAAGIAAALLVAAAWRIESRAAERVRVERVVDVAGAPPPVDERLLALTGGVEAVAMRRPTETR